MKQETLYTDRKCDRCERSNAVVMELPMRKGSDGDLEFENVDLCGQCIVKMTKHLFASKLPSVEKKPWLKAFLAGIIR
jgi:hypothetical protein